MLKNKNEFKNCLKHIAGDYYGPPKREYYYFYDVLFTGGAPYDCYWMREFQPDYIPDEQELKCHGQPHWKVVIWHMGVSNGKMWEYKK